MVDLDRARWEAVKALREMCDIHAAHGNAVEVCALMGAIDVINGATPSHEAAEAFTHLARPVEVVSGF